MVNSSPVLPHELQVQSLIGQMTTSSLRVLATTKNYRSNDGGSIGPTWATSFEAVATVAGEKSQPALWSELSGPSSSAPERVLLDAIAAGELDEHLVALADAIHAGRPAAMRSPSSVGDPVRINRNVRPVYLHGEHGVIGPTTPSHSAYYVPSGASAAASSAAHRSRSTNSTGSLGSQQPELARIASDQADRACWSGHSQFQISLDLCPVAVDALVVSV